MPHNTPKILIISSDTGGGHRSAAQAIAEGLQKFWKGKSVTVRVIKAVEESHHVTGKLVGVYNWILRNKQHWMKYVFWAMNRFRPETREFFHRRCIGYVREQFEKWCPHIVVSVHPLTQHIFARILKELNLAEQIPLVTVFDHNRYAQLSQMILDDTRNAVIKNNYGGDAGFFKAAIDLYMHDLIAKTKETGEPQMTCYAGTAGAVIFDEGTISSCENLEATGNLRDYDWNFQGAWNSPQMKARRLKAKSGCFCTHESNSYYPSLPFNPKHLIQIKKLERQMKKASKEMERLQPQNEVVAIKA